MLKVVGVSGGFFASFPLIDRCVWLGCESDHVFMLLLSAAGLRSNSFSLRLASSFDAVLRTIRGWFGPDWWLA
jgi:hypothetical protein